MDASTIEKAIKLQSTINKSLKILRKYDWLLNSYVLDFYVDDHWNTLPSSWREYLEPLEVENLSYLLINEEKDKSKKVWPLSLLCLRQLFKDLNISRKPQIEKLKDLPPPSPLLQHPKLRNLFTKCIKPKKRHELERMARICKRSCDKTKVDFILDFGAGLGHLARVLGYGYGVQVCCLEMQSDLSEQASIIDLHLEKMAHKHLPSCTLEIFRRPIHINQKLTFKTKMEDILEIIKKSLNITTDDFSFGIVGLHPCGDLSVILMQMLLKSPQAKFLNFVGCCYMKLTTASSANVLNDLKFFGYPLSNFLKEQNLSFSNLSYEALEISCHAAETYCDRLKLGDYEYLKVHSYRAAAERILVKHWPELTHCGLRSVKHTPELSFQDYFYKAVQGLPASQLASADLQTSTTLNDLYFWKRIVIFYSLRLMFAPLIENIILNDRQLYLMEKDCLVNIDAVFDPRISPRNHICSVNKR